MILRDFTYHALPTAKPVDVLQPHKTLKYQFFMWFLKVAIGPSLLQHFLFGNEERIQIVIFPKIGSNKRNKFSKLVQFGKVFARTVTIPTS